MMLSYSPKPPRLRVGVVRRGVGSLGAGGRERGGRGTGEPAQGWAPEISFYASPPDRRGAVTLLD